MFDKKFVAVHLIKGIWKVVASLIFCYAGKFVKNRFIRELSRQLFYLENEDEIRSNEQGVDLMGKTAVIYTFKVIKNRIIAFKGEIF